MDFENIWTSDVENVQELVSTASSGIESSKAQKQALAEKLRLLNDQAKRNSMTLTGDGLREARDEFGRVKRGLDMNMRETRDASQAALDGIFGVQQGNLRNTVNVQTETLRSAGSLVAELLRKIGDARSRVTENYENMASDDLKLNSLYGYLKSEMDREDRNLLGNINQVTGCVRSELPASVNATLTARFGDLKKLTANVTDFVEGNGAFLLQASAQQQLLIEEVIEEVRKAMKLAQTEDDEFMASEMSAQLTHVNSTEQSVNSTQD